LNGHSGPRSEPVTVPVRVLGPDGSVAKSLLSDWTVGTNLRLQLGGADEIQRPLEENPWLHACATAMSTAVAAVPLRIYAVPPGTAGDDDAGQEVTNEADPVYRLLHAPNRFDVWGDFAKRGVFHRIGNGEDWWFLAGPDGKSVPSKEDGTIPLPTQIIQASGACISEADTDEWGMPKAWRYSASGGRGAPPPFPVASVLSFLDPDPYNRFRGLGAAEVLARELGQYFQAQRYIEGLARNGGELGGILKMPNGISGGEVEATQTKVDDLITNSENRGKYLVIGADADFIPNGITPKDMEFKALFEWVRDCICSATHVPPPVIGVYTDATYNNIKTAHAEFWRSGVIPYLRSIEGVLNEKFFPRLVDPKLAAYRVYFDTSDIEALQEDNTAKIEAAARVSVQTGVTFNNALALFNVEAEVEGGDEPPSEPFDPFAPTEDEPNEEPESDEEDEDGDEEEERTAPIATTRAGAPMHERAARLEYWEQIERAVRLPGEKRVRKVASTFLERYRDAQIARLRAFAKNGKNLNTKAGQAFAALGYVSRDIAPGDEAELARQAEILLLNKKEWEAKMSALFDAPLRSVASTALAGAAAETGGVSIGVGSPRIVDALGRQMIQLTEGATSTLANRVRTRLMDELAKATSIGDLQEKVKEVLPELEGSVREAFKHLDDRALTIARTEVGHAVGTARHEQFKHDGVTSIQWVSEGDANVRESHKRVDGDVIPLGGTFSNGLHYPGDERAPADEVINCRCHTAPVTEP
jgi:SPP1 gp7 family putative phage head morphogenesis protein